MMLQQTQVETVIPYYQRFLERFPDFAALANANEEEVLTLWSGLGYYRRAKNLHACAKAVRDRHEGGFPTQKAEVLSLPGVGPYTAGALLSIAFDQLEPLVDGNVERVLSRVFAMEEDLARSSGKKRIWDLALKLLPSTRTGDFNQALMELGATICKPLNPKCEVCPWSGYCEARKTSSTHRFPVKVKNNRTLRVNEILLLAEVGGRWLLVDHNSEALYSGLWQFPWIWILPEDEVAQGLNHLCTRLKLPSDLAFVHLHTKHAVTYRKIETECFRIHLKEQPAQLSDPSKGYRWLTIAELERSPLPSYQRRLLSSLSGI